MSDFELQHIKLKSFHGEQEGPHLLILAGVHGNEYEPIAATTRLLQIVPKILTQGKVTIVPVVNESAFKNASRCGEDGLDLARTCPGNINGSITEVIAAEISRLISTSDYLIDLHTGGDRCEIAPFSGYTLHSSEKILNKQHQMACAFNLRMVWGTSPELEGRTLSVARDYQIPAIYAEYGGGGRFTKEIATEYVQGCLNILTFLGMSGGVLPSDRCEYIVKDYREESGNLEKIQPAPTEGFFETEVSLGEFVEKGDRVGKISDPLGEEIVPVSADQDGIVFLLRTIPSVKKQDSLCGILPINRPGEVVIYD